jgi:hypothetical protein
MVFHFLFIHMNEDQGVAAALDSHMHSLQNKGTIHNS